MTATEAFTTLVKATLDSPKARRFVELAVTKKGQAKLLDVLAHRFESAVRPEAVVAELPPRIRQAPCYVFHYSMGYGVEFPSFDDAYIELSMEDSWLIVSVDGSVGMHRPECRWDAERVFAK